MCILTLLVGLIMITYTSQKFTIKTNFMWIVVMILLSMFSVPVRLLPDLNIDFVQPAHGSATDPEPCFPNDDLIHFEIFQILEIFLILVYQVFFSLIVYRVGAKREENK